jgi:hypothetical protein
MTAGRGYRAPYDSVELLVGRRENHWSLSLKNTQHDETFETPAQLGTLDPCVNRTPETQPKENTRQCPNILVVLRNLKMPSTAGD